MSSDIIPKKRQRDDLSDNSDDSESETVYYNCLSPKMYINTVQPLSPQSQKEIFDQNVSFSVGKPSPKKK